MASTFSSWWQKHWRSAVAFVVVLFSIFVLLAYVFRWDWVGVSGENSKVTITMITPGATTATPATTVAREHPPEKNLWDWLGLLAALGVPLVVGLGVAWFTIKFNEQQSRTEHETTLDNQRAKALQDYINSIAALLLDRNLHESQPDAEVRVIARARTLTVLHMLDASRKGDLLRFLSEAQLITHNATDTDFPILDLSNADLSSAELSDADLSGNKLYDANLSGANLNRADLSKARLIGANLSGANLSGAYLSPGALLREVDLLDTNLSGHDLSGLDLSGAELTYVKLSGADLSDAKLNSAVLQFMTDLSNVDLSGADLSDAYLWEVNLSSAKLNGAKLNGAVLFSTNLSNIDLNGADLSDADLSNAALIDVNLNGAIVTKEQLDKGKKGLRLLISQISLIRERRFTLSKARRLRNVTRGADGKSL